MTSITTPLTFDDLVRMARRIAIPQPDANIPTIEPGQVWHLQWDGASEIGFVTESDQLFPRVVPLSFGRSTPDQLIEIFGLDAEAEPLWEASRSVPAVTFRGLLGHTEPTEPFLDDSDDTEPAVEAEFPLEPFSTWISQHEGTGELPQLLRATGMPVSRIAAETNVDRSTVLDLLRGEHNPDPDLTTALAKLLKITIAEVQHSRPSLPNDLKQALSARRVRTRIKSFAGTHHSTDTQAWVDTAYGVLAMPFRTTGGRSDESWDSKVDRFFEVNL